VEAARVKGARLLYASIRRAPALAGNGNAKDPMTTRLITISLMASLAACGGQARGPEAAAAAAAPAAPLYDRLGRKDAIAAVVKDFVEQRVAGDHRINGLFASADLPGLEMKLVEQICEATGGPCKYTGLYKDMKTAHAGMAIKDADFTAVVEDFKASLDQLHVGAAEQQELLGALARMHDDIVTAK
jgi:hemoglobin